METVTVPLPRKRPQLICVACGKPYELLVPIFNDYRFMTPGHKCRAHLSLVMKEAA